MDGMVVKHLDLVDKQLEAAMAMIGFHPAYEQKPDLGGAKACLMRAADKGSAFACVQVSAWMQQGAGAEARHCD